MVAIPVLFQSTILRENTQKTGDWDTVISLRNPQFPLYYRLSSYPTPALKQAGHRKEKNVKKLSLKGSAQDEARLNKLLTGALS